MYMVIRLRTPIRKPDPARPSGRDRLLAELEADDDDDDDDGDEYGDGGDEYGEYTTRPRGVERRPPPPAGLSGRDQLLAELEAIV